MIYLMRHGLDGEEYVGGWSDRKLTEIGQFQVYVTATQLKDWNVAIDRIISSDIRRARMSADIVGRYLQLPITDTDQLRELNKGALNGMEINLAKQKYPDYFQDVTVATQYPEGESMLEFYERMKKILPWILEQDHALLVTHRGVINMLYFLLAGREPDMDKKQFGVDYASVHELDPVQKTIRKKVSQ